MKNEEERVDPFQRPELTDIERRLMAGIYHAPQSGAEMRDSYYQTEEQDLSPGTQFAALRRLAERGFVTSRSDSEDSRANIYEITEAGQAVVEGDLRKIEETVWATKILLDL